MVVAKTLWEGGIVPSLIHGAGTWIGSSKETDTLCLAKQIYEEQLKNKHEEQLKNKPAAHAADADPPPLKLHQ